MTERWSAEAQRRIAEIAARNGFSEEAGLAMAEAITRGVGSMAQFNHRDLGGQGQWVKGGMLMVADMFNDGLKARVRSLAEALAEATQRGAIQPTSPGGSGTTSAAGTGAGSAPPRNAGGEAESGAAAARTGNSGWWPDGLGQPGSSGSQNGLRYAIFPAARRVAVERGGRVSVHDTGDHHIGGVSQQQGTQSSVRFTSQHGEVALDALPEVRESASAGGSASEEPGDPDRHRSAAAQTQQGAAGKVEAGAGERPQAASDHPPAPAQAATDARPEARDPLELIRKLAELRDAGILTDAEFSAKKTELLARL